MSYRSKREKRRDIHLIRVDDDMVVSSEVGIVHPVAVKVGIALLVIIAAALFGLMIWQSVVYADERPYYAPSAKTATVGNYKVYYNRAAEPFNGQPSSILTSVASVDTCTAACTAQSDCVFFTHDVTNSKCYLYVGGVLPSQYTKAGVPGPTSLDADVYVKLGAMASELRGILKNGDDTIM
jgi:hypothetical protein